MRLACVRHLPPVPALLLICFTSLAAQDSAHQQPKAPAPDPPTAASPQLDVLGLAAAIGSSYYHPDDLSSMHCAVEADWDALATQLKSSSATETINALKQAKVRVHAERGKEPRVDVDWGPGDVANKEILEEGMRKALSGFFKIYWPLDASSISPTTDENPKLEAADDGGYVVRFDTPDAQVAEEVDKRGIVTRLSYTSPAGASSATTTTTTTILEPRFSEAPNDIPGHPRLLTAIDVTQQMGTTKAGVHVALDYQSAGGVHIPSHVTFAIPQSYTFPLQFTGCSVTRTGRTAP
jgi:hypothetical protein